MADSKVRTILEVVDRTKPGITSAVKGLDRLARSSGALNRNILAMAGGRGIAGAVGGGAGGLGSLGSLGAAFATVTVRGIRFASTLESAALQLDFMTRKTRGFADGSKFAAQHLKTLTELARKSPLDLQELLQASTVLETFGAAALNNTKLLRGFVDAASALQQSMGPGGMLQISRQLGEILKVGAQGRGVGQALRVLETRGLGSAGIREAIAEINERGIQGTVEATEVMKQAIMGLFEGYEGAAEAASDTTSGLWQKAVETFDTMAAGLMRVTGLQEGWNNVMRFSIDLMESLTTVRPTAVNPGFSRHIGRTSAPGGRAGSGFAGLEMGFGAHTPAGTAARAAYEAAVARNRQRTGVPPPGAIPEPEPPDPGPYAAEIMFPSLAGMTPEARSRHLSRRSFAHQAARERAAQRAAQRNWARTAALPVPAMSAPGALFGVGGTTVPNYGPTTVRDLQMGQLFPAGTMPVPGMDAAESAIADATERASQRAEQQRNEQIRLAHGIMIGVQGIAGGIQRGGVGGALQAGGGILTTLGSIGSAAKEGSALATLGAFLTGPAGIALSAGLTLAGGLIGRDRDRRGGVVGARCPDDSFVAYSDRPNQLIVRQGNERPIQVNVKATIESRDTAAAMGTEVIGT